MMNRLHLVAALTIMAIMTSSSSLSAQSAKQTEISERLVIAHRGASGYLPEHTLAAKALAFGQGADFIEQDVVLTKDGVPIVLHDIHLDTVTDVAKVFPDRKREDGHYYAIDFTLAEIRRLSVNERIDIKTGKPVYPTRFPQNKSRFAIPTLAEEIELIQGLNASSGRDVGIYPEIKKPAFHRAEGQDISKIVVKLLAEYGYSTKQHAMYLQCFDWNETQRIRGELGYKGNLIQLLGENDWNEAPDVDFDELMTDDGLDAIAKVADGIGPWTHHLVEGLDEKKNLVTTDLTDAAKERGLAVHAYTLRADALPEYAESLEAFMEILFLALGVDGVFTDFPDVAARFMQEISGVEAVVEKVQ